MIASVSAPVGTAVILHKTAPHVSGATIVLIAVGISGMVVTFGYVFIAWIAKRWDAKRKV